MREQHLPEIWITITVLHIFSLYSAIFCLLNGTEEIWRLALFEIYINTRTIYECICRPNVRSFAGVRKTLLNIDLGVLSLAVLICYLYKIPLALQLTPSRACATIAKLVFLATDYLTSNGGRVKLGERVSIWLRFLFSSLFCVIALKVPLIQDSWTLYLLTCIAYLKVAFNVEIKSRRRETKILYWGFLPFLVYTLCLEVLSVSRGTLDIPGNPGAYSIGSFALVIVWEFNDFRFLKGFHWSEIHILFPTENVA